ncbi:MAG: hypothetical protein LN412_00795 [Candidatus Thermoplasmatota archaeon]|nr:hypothetical protein [Candidatus Thermoplasmatota archaeon]
MKRKSEKTMVDVRKGVSVVHLNVGSGYLTYIEDEKGHPARVKNVVLEGHKAEEED